MIRYPKASQAGFLARWRSAAHRPGDAETGSVEEPRPDHTASSTRRRLAGAGGLFAALGLVAGMLQVATSLPASALTNQTLYASPTGTGVAPCTTQATPCTLAVALVQSNSDTGDTINLATGTYPTAAYSITSSQNWTGVAGTIISGGAPPVTVAASTTVAFNTLTIKSGTTGGIANSGTLSLTSVTVTGNTGGSGISNVTSSSSLSLTSVTIGPGNVTAAKGGGIDNNGTVTTGATASTITGNTATGDGGGIDNESGASLTATGLVVSGNSSSAAGGGIANEPGALALSLTGGTIGGASSTFGNVATTTGGGIANLVTTISPLTTLSGVTVSWNSATTLGGGIYSKGPLSVTNGSISNNTATTAGGGLYNAAASPAAPPTLTGVAINGNQTGTTGGGIADIIGGLVMTGGSLSNNSTTAAGTDGGGAWINTTPSNTTDTFSGVAISGNTAHTNGGAIAVETHGGLILNASGSTLTTVSGNTATTGNGGGLYLTSTASFTCTTSPSAPGGPSSFAPLPANFCVEAGTTISSNSAPGGNGGGIALEGGTGTLQITNSTVGPSNFALTNGGGIEDGTGGPGQQMSIVNSTVTGNSVQLGTGTGGGISGGFGTSPFSLIYDSTIATNSIPNATASGTGNGAGLYNQSGFTMTNDTIYGNGSASFGGGIFNNVSGKLVLTNVTFSANDVKTSLGGAGFWGVTGDTSTSLGSIFAGDSDFTASGNVQDECGGTASVTPNTPPASLGYNLDQEHTCGFVSAGDQTGSNTAALQGLASNGGPTQTDALGGTSTAIGGDGISNSSDCPTVDQRGNARNGLSRGKCDIGAFDTGGGGAGLTATTTSVTVSPSSVSVGASVTYSATVSGGATPGGTVSFTAAGTATCVATLSGGAGSCSATNAPSGSDTVVGTYSGDGGHSGSSGSTTLTVSGSLTATSTAVTVSPSSTSQGTSVLYSATVSGGATPTGSVSFTAAGAPTCTATLSSGSGSCSASNAPVGTDSVVGTYGGDGTHSGSSGTATLVVSGTSSATVTSVSVSPSSVASGATVTFSAVVSGGSTTPTGAVTFTANGVTQCAVTLAGGAGSCTSASSPVGTDSVVGTYAGDATHAASSGSTTLTVSGAAPPPAHGTCVANGFTGNSAFICQVYLDLLGRLPDGGGLNTWNAALNSGTSRNTVAYDVATSGEYRTDFIQADYQAFLGRAADAGGLSTWLGAFNAGATDEAVDAGILGSAEFFARSGSTNSGFINNVYQGLLGRPADSGGLATWNGQLNSGVSRTQVAFSIDNSQESRTDTIQFFYQALLNRAADPGGLSTWLGALNSGSTDEAVLAGICGSTEFFNIANS